MNEKSHLNHLLLLIIATLLISTSGALGKFIAMPVPVIIWWRTVLAALFLLFLIRIFFGSLASDSGTCPLLFLDKSAWDYRDAHRKVKVLLK